MHEIRFPEIEHLEGPPEIRKSGIISSCGGECSVFVWQGRLMRLENQWDGFGDISWPCAVVRDYFTDEPFIPFGSEGAKFYSCYCENDCVYAFATQDNKVFCFTSQDLLHWKQSVAVVFPDNFRLFNTAVCKGDGCYMMAVEASAADDENGNFNAAQNPYIGTCFTEFFAKSADLHSWELLSFEHGYTKDRYNACPALHYADGYYYMICLEELPCWRFAPYIYRTSDFCTWEISYYNPIFIPSREDLSPKIGVHLSDDELNMQFQHLNTNNSDVDLCEFNGKTYIVYCSGNQGITWGGCTCEAIYNGPLNSFLKSNFN